jgi:capsular exopolysaccharide synthesis family protein
MVIGRSNACTDIMEMVMGKMYKALVDISKKRKPEQAKIFSHVVEVRKKVVYSPPVPSMEKGMLLLFQRIEALLPDVSNKVVQFIGSKQGEGASTIAREFAKISAFSIGKQVLLIDADRFHPSHHHFFGTQYEKGWQEIIRNKQPAGDAIHCFESSNLFLCPSSNTTKFTPELFDTGATDPFLNTIKQQFDLLVIDSTPITKSPDGLGIVPKTDGVIIVVEAEKTKWTVVENTMQQIQNVGGNILGMVLNKRNYHIPGFIYRFLG